MIYRTYGCNKCKVEFTTGDEDPACPKCESMELHWIPVAGHGGILSGSTRATDSYFKGQADRFGMTDFQSAKAGEAMAPRMRSQPKQTAPVEVAPGISVPISLNSQNQPQMSIQNFTPTKGMVPTFGSAMPVNNAAMPSMKSLTETVGSYDGRK